MSARNLIAAGILAMLGAGTAALAVAPDVKARIAGDGPNAKYYLARDLDAGIVIHQLHGLELRKAAGEPKPGAGYQLSDVDAALTRVRATRDALLAKGRLIEVVYNLHVTTAEKDDEVHYALFPDPSITAGKESKGTLTRVRVDDGPLQGRLFYARRLVDRTHAVITDRVRLRAEGMKAIPVTEDPIAAADYWKALSKNDQTAAAQAYIDGKFVQLPLETECTVVGLSKDHVFAQVRAKRDGASHDFWVLASVASVDPPRTARP